MTITEGVTGSCVKMAVVSWFPLAGPFHFFLCAPTLQKKKYEFLYEVRLQLGSHSLNQNNKAVISNNAQLSISCVCVCVCNKVLLKYKGDRESF